MLQVHGLILVCVCIALTSGCNDDRVAASADDDAGVGAGLDAGDGGGASADAAPIISDTGSTGADATSVDPAQCVPFADACAEGTYCQYVNGDLRCVPEGDVVPDPGGTNPECPDGVCSRGGICMPSRDGFGGGQSGLTCYQPCDVSQPVFEAGCFNGRHTCWPAEDDGDELSFGLCAY